ncbi:MAG: hypothetical protein H6765_01190 [Candidatus Peribacteria bacterium]|nr:MAG: hypothetical protein H6765_01190 [Candidatus Peribacteria bacterium]
MQDEVFLANFLVDLWSQRAHTSLEQDLSDLCMVEIPDNVLLHEALFTMCKSKIF